MDEMNHKINVDYKQFLSRHDMIWDQFPKIWDDSPFLGNGLLGAMVCQKDASALRFDIGNSLVYDHRCWENKTNNQLFYRCRLPVGHFALTFDKPLSGCNWRLNLHDACLESGLCAGESAIRFKSLVHTDEMLLLTVFDENSALPSRIEFIPDKAESPRQSYGVKYGESARILPGYRSNPAPVSAQEGDVYFCTQKLDNGWQTVTAWRLIAVGQRMLFAATVAHSQGEDGRKEPLNLLAALDAGRLDDLMQSHRKAWSLFYQKSFLSIPDTALESFYWIQMYKINCATRPDRAIMDNQGPWLQETAWPAIWWNLNVQLAYSPVFAANHTEHFECVWNTMQKYEANLIENVAPQFRGDSAGIGTMSDYELHSPVMVPWEDDGGLLEIGNLTWVLHSCWQYYRMRMDRAYLRDFFMPLLKKSVSYAMHFLFERDGKLHLMPTASPEYGVVAEDTNYELSLLRWGLHTLISINQELGENDPSAPKWEDTLERLTVYPVGENGFLIAKDVPYAKSHRHYSHLLMAYPLYIVNREQDGASKLIRKSIEHWQSMPEELQGYSFTGAASLYAALGDGAKAISSLRRLWGGFLRRNTLYKESGPVIETPFSAARSIQDMLLQSWGGKIRVFPAVPPEWKDVSFANMRAEGAFMVSSVRKDKQTQFVRISSLGGEPCILQCDFADYTQDNHEIKVVRLDSGDLCIGLAAGEQITLYNCEHTGEKQIEPVLADMEYCNCYGLNRKTHRIISALIEDNRIQ